MRICLILGFVLVFGSGCATSRLLPSEEREAVGFNSFESAYSSYNEIRPGETTRNELSAIGFDTLRSTNTEVLTYTDVLAIFMNNPNIGKNDLPSGVLECLKAQSGCQAYRFHTEQQDKDRYGNFFVDMLNFRKKERTTGWRFEALVIIVDDVVKYSLHSGERNIDLKEIQRNPLGPLQDFGIGDIRSASGY